jgi:hypothetical protein
MLRHFLQMRKVRLSIWVIDEPQVEPLLGHFCWVATQSDIETVRVFLRLLVEAAAVVTKLHCLHVLMCGKLRGGSEHRSLIERLAHDSGIDVSPHHQAERSTSDQNGVSGNAEDPVEVKPRADLLRLRLQRSLPG